MDVQRVLPANMHFPLQGTRRSTFLVHAKHQPGSSEPTKASTEKWGYFANSNSLRL